MRIKMKHRLFLLIMLPFLATLGFVANLLLNKYHSLKSIEHIVELYQISDDISRLIKFVQLDKARATLLIKEIVNPTVFSDFEKLDEELQEAIGNIINRIKNYPSDTLIISSLNHTLTELNHIVEKHKLIENKQIDLAQISQYYESINDQLIASFSYIVNDIQNIALTQLLETTPLSQSIFLRFIMIHLRVDTNFARTLVYVTLSENGQISTSEYNQFIELRGRQQAYKQIYFEFAPDREDELFNATTRAPASMIVSMESLIYKSGPNVNIAIDPLMWWRNMSAYIDSLRAVEKQLYYKSIEESHDLIASIKSNILWTIIIIGLALGFAIYQILRSFRWLSNQLQHETKILTESVQEILVTVHDISNTTAQTANAINQTTNTIEELKNTGQDVSNKAKNASEILANTMDVLQQSEHAIDETIQGMNRIQDDMQTIHLAIIKLNEHNQLIGDIINTVNDLAEQSHLLAVNAAIEATRAEAQGKGFVVVAQEMHSLAEQSKQATIQIRKILHDIQNSMTAAVQATGQGAQTVIQGAHHSAQTNQSIRALAQKIASVVKAAEQIVTSSQKQLLGTQQVTRAMESIQKATDQQVNNMHQIEGRIANLNEVGQTLRDIIKEYRY